MPDQLPNFEIQNGVAIVRFDRPEKYNSFTRAMSLRLQDNFRACADDPSIRAVLLTGMGKAFGAGQDLQEVTEDNGIDIGKILQEHLNPLVQQIRNLKKPVVAAVNGVAAGAHANVALLCDVVVAAESASFIQAFTKIGLIPDSGGTHTLPRLVGWQRASALMLLGDKISATEAERMGMIYGVYPDSGFLENALKLAAKLAQMPTRALALTKQALQASMTNDLENQLVLEDKLQNTAAKTEDFAEGVHAFIEKRRAVFVGH